MEDKRDDFKVVEVVSGSPAIFTEVETLAKALKKHVIKQMH